MKSVGIHARQRVFGLTLDDARKEEAGTVIGRLLITKEISAPQFEAAKRYEEIVRLADAAILLSRNPPSAGDLNRSRGHDASEGDDPAYVAKCTLANRDANNCWRALKEAGQLCRWAVDSFVIENQNVQALGELRVGLNALCRVMKIPMHTMAA